MKLSDLAKGTARNSSLTPLTPRAKGPRSVVRVTANLPAEIVGKLQDIAKRKGTSLTAVISQMLDNALFFQDEIEKGNKVLLTTPEKDLRVVVLR